MNVGAISKKREKFLAWLAERGAQVLQPTNEYELVRFVCDHGTSIIYRNKRGLVTCTGRAEEAWQSFCTAALWRATQATKRTAKGSAVVRTLRERDGDRCFFCWLPMPAEDCTVDHLVEVTAGGPSHISNYVLMHRVCNLRTAGMSAAEKIRAHFEARTA